MMWAMVGYLSIGDFSRASHLTVKTLRHYHELGLLEPAEVDEETGYRRYATEQVPVAQVIRRFRALGMPLDDIRGVLSAPDVPSRNERIAAHLSRLEQELGRTQMAVASLRELMTAPGDLSFGVTLRSVPCIEAAAITEVIDAEDSVAWLQGALGEIRALLAAHGSAATGPAGGMYADELFLEHRGEATIFVPCSALVRPTGRVTATAIPAAELAVIEHRGSPSEVDRAYGALWPQRHRRRVARGLGDRARLASHSSSPRDT